MNNPIMSRIRNMLARVIVQILDESGHSFTILNGENTTAVEHPQEYGFASKIPANTKGNGVAIFYNGDRGNATLLTVECPSLKPTLEAGESALFNDKGVYTKCTTSGVLELNGTSNEGLVKINELTEKLNEFISNYNIHKHGTSPVPDKLQTAFDKSYYENTEVVH